MASAFNEQTDPGVVYKSFSASQQSQKKSDLCAIFQGTINDRTIKNFIRPSIILSIKKSVLPVRYESGKLELRFYLFQGI